MPLWLNALKLLPWAEVVRNAPLIADGAKKLWGAVGRKSGSKAPNGSSIEPSIAQSTPTLEILHARTAALENQVHQLERDMSASSELIKALADQQTQLVAALARARTRQRWIMLVCGLLIVAVLLLTGFHPN